MSNRLIEMKGICKNYGNTTVLKDLNLFIRKNEFVTLLGPSGCGKTTTLRIIGGFESPTSGDIHFDGKSALDIPPNKRRVNTVFQKYALFPHMNVFENIAFGLRIKKTPEKEIKEKIESILKLVNLKGFEKRAITSLSGGQQQRIAIARALVNEPEVLLLDEPLGALDLKLRQDMQLELKNMQKKLGITFVYVTHDQEEALTMSDAIAVMHNGVLQQIGTPEDIYNEPKNAFVADFIGESNIVDGVMVKDYLVKFAGGTFDCVDKGFDLNEPVDVVIRPEDIDLILEEDAQIKGVVKHVTFKGVHYEMLIDAHGIIWKVHSTVMSPVGQTVGIEVEPDLIHIMKKAVVE